jgi:hypothetical protein
MSKKLGEFLLEDNVVTPEQLQEALEVQKKNRVNWELSLSG